tara:strand:+ start:307 stop:510 length:204 start_codon:yes stop_codon:yes gene_type:complete
MYDAYSKMELFDKIDVLEERINIIEDTLNGFIKDWKKANKKSKKKRDELWDEMVRVVAVQSRSKIAP